MKFGAAQPELLHQHAVLRERLRSAGLVLLASSPGGELIARAPSGNDWLESLLIDSTMFRAMLKEAVRKWNDQSEPETIEVMPGLWVAAIPLMSRRRRAAYSVAVIPTDALLEAEQLAALCQSASADFKLIQRLLTTLPPASACDIDRLLALVRYLHDDHLRLASETQAIESVGKQLAESYEEMNLLYTIIQSMTVQQRPERFVAIACQELLRTLPYAWIGTQLGDDRDRLKSLAGRLIMAGESGQPASQLRSIARELLEQAQPDAPIVLEPGANASHAAYAALGRSAVVQPVCSAGVVMGLLIAGEKRGPDAAASSADIKLLAATATHMAIFLENAALYDDLNAMFLGTLEALTASIDAKDRYTCGHSRRVADLTQQLARAIGMDEHTVDRMHIAGLVHDVGKIGVPEAVLLKPGKLSAEEFAWIRQHPEMGYRILKDIPQLSDILPGVLHHHERWDGRGYPDGLAGESIPLVARLIALADSFDAMSSTRTYRAALSREQVLDEITRCSGSQFDPALATEFIKLDFSHFDRMVQDHQAREMTVKPSRQEAA